MASNYLIKTQVQDKSETLVVQPKTAAGVALTTVPAASTTYIVDLPPGVYRVAFFVDHNVTGTTTAFDDIRPFVDLAQSVVSTTANEEFGIMAPIDTVTTGKTRALTAGANGTYFVVLPNGGTASQRELPLLSGFSFLLTKGGATTGEKCVVHVVAQRCV